MAEFADDLVERMSNPDLYGMFKPWDAPWREPEQWDYADPDNCVWTTQFGERIRFADMTTSHRGNVVRMLVRKYGPTAWDKPTPRALIACGISPGMREELGIPTQITRYPEYFDTNQDEGVPR